MKNLTSLGHYIVGLAGLGAISALIAIGSISGSAGLPVIVAIVAALVGGGMATAAGTTTKTPQQ
jgi:hypothetical protein